MIRSFPPHPTPLPCLRRSGFAQAGPRGEGRPFISPAELRGILTYFDELPRRKQRGIKDHNGENPSPQGVGYSLGRKIKFRFHLPAAGRDFKLKISNLTSIILNLKSEIQVSLFSPT